MALIGLIIGLISESGGGTILWIIFGFFIGAILGSAFFGDLEKNGIRASKLVREYINDGWQFDKPGK